MKVRALIACLSAVPALWAQGKIACADMKQFSVLGLALEITAAESKSGHCRVNGVIDRRTGAGGKPYGIRFALALPDEWNGRFLMQGGGGLNGTVAPPIGPTAAGATPALARGFAVVSTDTGHEGKVFDGSFFADQQAALDFAYVAIGRVAVLAKQMVAYYYGKPAAHSYFTGCSTGGREGMIMTQRYPGYFDGVVSGAPAMRTGYSNLADRYAATMLNQVAPKDASGKPLTAQALSTNDKKLLMDALLAACDDKDGLRDGLIWNHDGCRFDPAVLTCGSEPRASASGSCLTPEQASAIRKAMAGPKNSRGVAVYPGFPWDTGITASGQGVIPGLLNPGPSPVGPPYTATEMDVDEAAAKVAADQQATLTDSTWLNLSTYSQHGGKQIFFHGMSDPWFSALDTLGYYQRMAEKNGGMAQVRNWSRIFLVPGMGHCGGGKGALDTFDLLTAIVDWVENGKAPDSVVATSKAEPARSRPLCAYPNYARYSGSGDSEKAENFTCKADQ
jgi:hypothetical protein